MGRVILDILFLLFLWITITLLPRLCVKVYRWFSHSVIDTKSLTSNIDYEKCIAFNEYIKNYKRPTITIKANGIAMFGLALIGKNVSWSGGLDRAIREILNTYCNGERILRDMIINTGNIQKGSPMFGHGAYFIHFSINDFLRCFKEAWLIKELEFLLRDNHDLLSQVKSDIHKFIEGRTTNFSRDDSEVYTQRLYGHDYRVLTTKKRKFFQLFSDAYNVSFKVLNKNGHSLDSYSAEHYYQSWHSWHGGIFSPDRASGYEDVFWYITLSKDFKFIFPRIDEVLTPLLETRILYHITHYLCNSLAEVVLPATNQYIQQKHSKHNVIETSLPNGQVKNVSQQQRASDKNSISWVDSNNQPIQSATGDVFTDELYDKWAEMVDAGEYRDVGLSTRADLDKWLESKGMHRLRPSVDD